MLNSFKGKKLIYKLLTIITFIGVVSQFGILIFINLTQMKYHMGFDASSYYLKALEMYKQGTIFVKNWTDQTTLYFDSAVPLAAFLMNIFKNIFVSYGVANIIIGGCIFLMLWNILEKFHIEYWVRFIAFNILLCPYIVFDFNNTNDIFYFSSTLTSGSWYGVKLLLSMLFIYVFVTLYENNDISKKEKILIIITIILYFISGVSSGYYLAVTILLPAVLVGFIEVLIENKWSKLISSKLIFTYLNLAAIFLGKFVSKHILLFSSKDSSEALISLSKFWNNVGSIFLGYIGLVNGLPNSSGQNALEIKGIIYICCLFIALIGIVGVIFIVANIIRKNNFNKSYVICPAIIIFNIIMFSLLETTYSGDVFERRYWAIPFYCVVICVAIWINKLEDKLILKQIGCLALIGCTLIETCCADYIYISRRVDIQQYDEVVAEADSLDIGLVYFYGEDFGIFSRNIRAYDHTRIYKPLNIDENGNKSISHWGDYQYFDNASDYQAKVMLISTRDNIEKLPDDILNNLEWVADISIGQVYTSEKNVLGL